MSDVFFQKAVPVWKADKEKELHSRCAFFTTFKKVENAELIITGANIYKVYLNGIFLCMGPARSAHEYFRVDRIPLRNLCKQNTLFIEAVAYNTKSYYQLDEPGFIQAEICSNGRVVAWTGKDFFVRTFS